MSLVSWGKTQYRMGDVSNKGCKGGDGCGTACGRRDVYVWMGFVLEKEMGGLAA